VLLILLLFTIMASFLIVFIASRTKPSVVVPVKVTGRYPQSNYVVGQILYADTEDLELEPGHVVRCFDPELKRHVCVSNLNLEVLSD
jgi:hypothetical protein